MPKIVNAPSARALTIQHLYLWDDEERGGRERWRENNVWHRALFISLVSSRIVLAVFFSFGSSEASLRNVTRIAQKIFHFPQLRFTFIHKFIFKSEERHSLTHSPTQKIIRGRHQVAANTLTRSPSLSLPFSHTHYLTSSLSIYL